MTKSLVPGPSATLAGIALLLLSLTTIPHAGAQGFGPDCGPGQWYRCKHATLSPYTYNHNTCSANSSTVRASSAAALNDYVTEQHPPEHCNLQQASLGWLSESTTVPTCGASAPYP